MSETIVCGDSEDFLDADEKKLFANPDSAQYNVLVECDLLPVGRMFGADGRIVSNPLHAFACVAFVGGEWQMVSCRPGDITPRLKDRPWLRSR